MHRFVEVTRINSDGGESVELFNTAYIVSVYPSARPVTTRDATRTCIEIAGYDVPVCVKEDYHMVRAAIGA